MHEPGVSETKSVSAGAMFLAAASRALIKRYHLGGFIIFEKPHEGRMLWLRKYTPSQIQEGQERRVASARRPSTSARVDNLCF